MSEVAIFQTLCLAFLAVGGRAKNRPELGEMAIFHQLRGKGAADVQTQPDETLAPGS